MRWRSTPFEGIIVTQLSFLTSGAFNAQARCISTQKKASLRKICAAVCCQVNCIVHITKDNFVGFEFQAYVKAWINFFRSLFYPVIDLVNFSDVTISCEMLPCEWVAIHQKKYWPFRYQRLSRRYRVTAIYWLQEQNTNLRWRLQILRPKSSAKLTHNFKPILLLFAGDYQFKRSVVLLEFFT